MKSFARIFFLAALLSLIYPPVSADQEKSRITLDQMYFLPPKYYPGDKVELRINLKFTGNIKLSIPSRFPDTDNLKIISAEIDQKHNEAEIKILFTSFLPGNQTIPDLVFGDFVLNDVKINTSSILQDNPSPFIPSREQLAFPGTGFYIAIFLGILLIGPALVIFSWLKGRKFLRNLFELYKARRPWRQFRKFVEKLKKQKTSFTYRELYLEITKLVKTYFTQKIQQNYLAATVTEAEALFHGIPEIPESDKQFFIEFLKKAEEIKFSDVQDLHPNFIEDAGSLIAAVKKFEFGIRRNTYAEL